MKTLRFHSYLVLILKWNPDQNVNNAECKIINFEVKFEADHLRSAVYPLDLDVGEDSAVYPPVLATSYFFQKHV